MIRATPFLVSCVMIMIGCAAEVEGPAGASQELVSATPSGAAPPTLKITLGGRIVSTIEDGGSTIFFCDPTLVDTVEVRSNDYYPGETYLHAEPCEVVRATAYFEINAISDTEAEVSGETQLRLRDCIWTGECYWGFGPDQKIEPQVVTLGEEIALRIPSYSGVTADKHYTIEFNGWTATSLP